MCHRLLLALVPDREVADRQRLAELQQPPLAHQMARLGLAHEVDVEIGGDRHRHRPGRGQRLEAGAPVIREHIASGNCALLFGSEKFGLSNSDLSHCHWLMHIPTREEHWSMNLGQAAAICLYELVRNRKLAAKPKKGSPASSEDVERMTDTLIEALRASEYPKLNTSKSFHNAVRRMVRRFQLQQGDAEFFLGMLRQMVWKLGQNEKGKGMKK